MKYELSTRQLNNLIELLNRTPLKGSEVFMFTEIINIFRNPIKNKNKLKKKNDNKN